MALLSVVSALRTRTVPLQQPALLPALLKRLPLQVYLSALLQDLICPTIRRMAPHSSTFPLDTTKVVLRLSNALIAFLAVLLLRPSVSTRPTLNMPYHSLSLKIIGLLAILVPSMKSILLLAMLTVLTPK
jgi:hypothetical protein